VFHLKLIKKEIYLSFLLSIILFASIDILLYNYTILGNEEDDNNNNDVDDVREKEEYKDEEEDIEDTSINELFDNDNNDNRDNNDEIIEKEDTEENVPFILPFNAVPFP
jgi:hypothetical protein